jgi:dodecin
MPDSTYKIIEVVGSSPESWEKAAQNAIKRVSETIRDLRIAEVSEMDMHINDGKVEFYRVKMKISFKYQDHH